MKGKAKGDATLEKPKALCARTNHAMTTAKSKQVLGLARAGFHLDTFMMLSTMSSEIVWKGEAKA